MAAVGQVVSLKHTPCHIVYHHCGETGHFIGNGHRWNLEFLQNSNNGIVGAAVNHDAIDRSARNQVQQLVGCLAGGVDDQVDSGFGRAFHQAAKNLREKSVASIQNGTAGINGNSVRTTRLKGAGYGVRPVSKFLSRPKDRHSSRR
jgi:hypothetical protein